LFNNSTSGADSGPGTLRAAFQQILANKAIGSATIYIDVGELSKHWLTPKFLRLIIASLSLSHSIQCNVKLVNLTSTDFTFGGYSPPLNLVINANGLFLVTASQCVALLIVLFCFFKKA